MNSSPKWQQYVRAVLEDLKSTLSLANHGWSEWEFNFIKDVCAKLDAETIELSAKQYEKVQDLWEKI